MTVGIDASNIREGGGLNHLYHILNEYDPSRHKIKKIIVWGNSKILKILNENEIIKKKQIF